MWADTSRCTDTTFVHTEKHKKHIPEAQKLKQLRST